MRVIRKINIFSLMQIAQRPASLDAPLRSGEGEDDLRLGDVVEGPSLLPEDVNDLVETEVFARLVPGRERICAVLVAEGFDYPMVGRIMGISDYQVRKRLLESPTGHHMSPLRVWDTRSKTMHYVATPDGLGTRKSLRVMPWTGFYDVTHERIYLWDIVQCAGQIALVTHWKNSTGSGYIPFSLATKTDWLGSSRVIGNRYQHATLVSDRSNE